MPSTPVTRYHQITEEEASLIQRGKPNLVNEPDRNSRFLQQNLAAWHPIRSTQCVILTFFLASLLCIVLGVCIIAIGNQDVVEFSKRYDNIKCNAPSTSYTKCTKSISITAESSMKPPIFLYYKLVDFYQNHRTYTASEKKILAAQYNDKIDLESASHGIRPFKLTQDPTRIVWDSDLSRFPAAKGDPLKQREIVWSRVAAMPTFKKLYTTYTRVQGNDNKVVPELPTNSTLTFKVVDDFDGAGAEKWIVVSTTSRLGGTQYFLAWSFIFVGAVMLTVGSLMACMTYISTTDHEKYFIQ